MRTKKKFQMSAVTAGVKSLMSGEVAMWKVFWIYFLAIPLLASVVAEVTGVIHTSVFGVIIVLYGLAISFALWRSARKYEGLIIWKWLGFTQSYLSILSFIGAMVDFTIQASV